MPPFKVGDTIMVRPGFESAVIFELRVPVEVVAVTPLRVLTRAGVLSITESFFELVQAPMPSFFGGTVVQEPVVPLYYQRDYQVPKADHSAHEVVENTALNKKFKYCRTCKEEV